MLITSKKILSGMMIILPHGTLKKYKLKFQQELSKTLLNTINQGNALCKLKFLKSFSLPKNQTLFFHKNLSV